MPHSGQEGLFVLLDRIESAAAPQLPGLVRELTRYVRGQGARTRQMLDEAEREAPRYQRKIDALRQDRDDLEDDLEEALTTGEVALSVLAEHLKLLERREAELLVAVQYEDIGVGD